MGVLKLGNDYMVWISTTQAGTYTLPAGQQDGTLTTKVATFDVSTKDSGGYALNAGGLASVSLSLSLEPLLPDANGYTLMQATALTYPRVPLYVKIRKNGLAATDADTIFGAAFLVTSLDGQFKQNGVVMTPFGFDLTPPGVFVALNLA